MLPNMASFLMTRRSVMGALRNGITADQICSFLENYSDNATRLKEVETKLDRNRGNAGVGTVEDANMKGKEGYYSVPLNVMDQLYLWEVRAAGGGETEGNESSVVPAGVSLSRSGYEYVRESGDRGDASAVDR